MMLQDDRRVLFVQYVNPGAYPPLEHSSLILARAGWKVLFLGIGAMGSANRLKSQPHQNIVVRQLEYCDAGWRQKLHFMEYCLWVLGWVLRWRPQWIYASDLVSCPVALALSFLPGLRTAYHEHDSPDIRISIQSMSSEPDSKNHKLNSGAPISRTQRFLLWCRERVAQRANFCVLPNEKRAELFKSQTHTSHSVLCVWNCPRREEVIPLKQNSKVSKYLHLAFHGSINGRRLPIEILEAMSGFQGQIKLSVVGYETVGSRGYMKRFLQEAARFGLGDAVEFVGALPARIDVFNQAARCNVGLAFMPKQGGDVNMANMAGASNKPFDYLACGLALLVSDLPEWNDMFVKPGYGLACDPDDSDSITRALRWFLEHPIETAEMGARGRAKVLEDWNYESEFREVLNYMSKD